MEHSEPCRDSGPRDHQATCGRGELSWDAICDSAGSGQDPFAPSGTVPAAASTPSSVPVHGGLDFLQNSLEAICCKGAFPELPQNHQGRTFHTELPPPLPPEPESLPTSSSERFWLGSAPKPLPESRKHLDQSSSDATQALFWTSIFQAQQCILDLQGEIDRKKEPPGSSAPAVEEAPTMAMLQDWVAPCEPFQLGSDSEEEDGGSSGRQGEETASLDEEEMDYLFCNNPLFQESLSSARALRFEGPALSGQAEGQAAVCGEEEGPSSRDLGFNEAGPFCQTLGSGSHMSPEHSSVPELYADKAPCPLLGYVPHCRSLSPLVIMEGDPDEPCLLTEGIKAQSSFPDQQAHSPSVRVAESVVPGAPYGGHDPPAGGLLFSPSGTSLTSVLLLQEPPEIHPPCKPPLPPPAKATGGPSSSLALPAPARAEQSLGEKALGPWAPSHSHHGPVRAWAGQSSETSSLQKEAAAQEMLSSISTLDGAGRKLGSSAEGFARVTFRVMPDAMEETLGEEEEEEEEEDDEEEEEEEEVGLPRPQCSPDGDALSNCAAKPEEALQATSLGDPGGKPLFSNGGAAGDQASALRLATCLYHLDGFQRSQVAAFLQKNNEFSQKVAEAYLSFFEFSGQTLDQALRSFLKVIVLTGETQERERILWHFSQRYHRCNPQAFRSPDAVHTLTCAIMLLNTDLHGQNIGRSMSCQAFLANLEGLNDGQNFPKELLKALYSSIYQEKLRWAVDEGEVADGAKQLQPSAASGSSFSSQKKSRHHPFLSLAHDSGAETYRQGLLARKVHAEADGKKTPWGKRGWKVFHTMLKGMVLYFFKEESRPEGLGTEEPIGVHHALAEPASKYTKRPHVFRLQTADWHIFLFQAPSAEEMSSWVSRINLVAAMFSSPPFPAAVGSQRKFFRPILPTAPCKNSLASNDLLQLQRNLPERRGVRGRDLEEYRLRKEYLLYEKRRYETYVRLLEVKLSSNAAKENLDQWEARLGKSEEGGSCPSLQKSHSSPSLNAEGPASSATVKVKRNISERRTVRRIIPRRNKHLL
ncbi:hypothetical protein JRQ81_011270 [Phrynocephalus forsythii]|uniref:PH and SEC7 domain-containing protein 4 n=1 Tax=Phrynocephalus forsythii TaxID=171643 RepID=A0A9Q0X7R9_9SAUR|nr:hypothetical protein JRQ81_011270 [Phrynocephalus forsythii]